MIDNIVIETFNLQYTTPTIGQKISENNWKTLSLKIKGLKPRKIENKTKRGRHVTFLIYLLNSITNFALFHYIKSQIILRPKFYVINFTLYLVKVIIQVSNGNGVLNRLVSYLKCMELAC